MIAPELSQDRVLSRRFDPLGKRVQFKPLRKDQDRRDDVLLVEIGIDLGDEGAVDLDPAYRESLDIGD